jgi:hypothetical protein
MRGRIWVHIVYATHTYPHAAICLYTCPHTGFMCVLILLYVCEDAYSSMEYTHNIVVYSAQIFVYVHRASPLLYTTLQYTHLYRTRGAEPVGLLGGMWTHI